MQKYKYIIYVCNVWKLYLVKDVCDLVNVWLSLQNVIIYKMLVVQIGTVSNSFHVRKVKFYRKAVQKLTEQQPPAYGPTSR